MAVSKKPALPETETVRMPLAMLLPADYNPRRISDRAMKGLRASLERFGELGGIVYNKRTGSLVGGHQRVKALAAMGIEDAEVRVVDLPVAEEKAANLALNHPGIGGEWDDALLAVVLDEVKRDLPTAFEELQLGDIIGDGLGSGSFDDGHGSDDGGEGQTGNKSLADRFGVPPFSVLDARQGYWQDRKRAWLALGIQSELGRGGGRS